MFAISKGRQGDLVQITTGKVEIVGFTSGITIVSSGIVAVSSGNVAVTNFPSTYDVSDRASRVLGIVTNVTSGTIAVSSGNVVVSSGNVIVTNITSGVVAVSSGTVNTILAASSIMQPSDIQAQYYSTVCAIATGLVNPGASVSSSAIDIDAFRTKTVNGWAQFDGTLTIYVAPISGQFHPYPYSTINVSSGAIFSTSFTDSYAQMSVTLTNTSSTTGNACVYVDMGVL